MGKIYPYGKGDGAVQWVSTEWLEEHLEDTGMAILDCQPNVHEYIRDHIPGALYVNEGLFRVHEKNMPSRWIPAGAAQALCRSFGLDPHKPVVVYSGSGPMTACASFIGDGLEQTMVAYSLVRYGHRNILVLDGGLDKWMEEKRAVTREFGSAEPSFFRANVRKEYFISYEQFLALREKDDVVLLDARPPAYYEGQGPWIKPGHIPGAVSLPWKGLMDDRNKKLLRPEDQIEAMVNAAGATPDRTVICSCGTGREATNEFLLFRWYLGYGKVVLYEGGFTEWSSYEDNPVVTGKSPR